MSALAEFLIEPRIELQTFGIEVTRCSVESLYPCVCLCVCVCVCERERDREEDQGLFRVIMKVNK